MARLSKAGLEASFGYGVQVIGCSNQDLESPRATVYHAFEPSPTGKSNTLCFLMSEVKDIDPIFKATLDPLVFLVRAVWESWMPLHVMAACLEHAQRKGPGQRSLCSLQTHTGKSGLAHEVSV